MFNRFVHKTGTKLSTLAHTFKPAMATRMVMTQAMLPSRSFSTSGAAGKLAKALEKELTYEKDNYVATDDTAAFLDESGFNFFEDRDGINCYLKKEADGKVIEVHFQARPPPAEEEGLDMPEGAEDENFNLYDNNMVEFSVVIRRDGSETGLLFDCASSETEISISNVAHSDQISKDVKTARFERNFCTYNGPDFNSLDERLQAGLSEFLQAHGIDEHLAAFVEVMSLDKDNRLYMQWLEDMQNFVNP